MISTDSIARALNVGSVVTGDVRRLRDRVTITVRLIDAATSTQVARASASGSNRDGLAVRARLLDSVTSFLRRELGEQVGERQPRGTTNPEAWALLAQARGMGEGELRLAAALAPRNRTARFAMADSLLMRAAALDPRWAAPYVASGRLFLLRAGFEENVVLRAGSSRRRDMADAWNDLSNLLQLTGNYEGSRVAAEAALTADAFLRSAEAIVGRLHFTSLAIGRIDDARMWCQRGRTRYSSDPRFRGCDLTTIGWTGRTAADVATAWQLLRDSEARDTSNLLAAGWGTRRLLVAAVAARAGLADSALAIVTAVLQNAPSIVATDQFDYGEAHVCTLLGDTARALPLLARYLQANPALRGPVRNSPWFQGLRTNRDVIQLTLPRGRSPSGRPSAMRIMVRLCA